MKIRLSTRMSLVLLAFALSAGIRSVAAAPANGTVIAKISYAFPKYESVEGMDFYAEKTEYDAAVSDPKFTFEKLKTASDGLSIVTYFYRSAEPANRKFPVIIFSRGSATMGDAAPQLIAFFHRLASQGFLVIAPQYRGSDG